MVDINSVNVPDVALNMFNYRSDVTDDVITDSQINCCQTTADFKTPLFFPSNISVSSHESRNVTRKHVFKVQTC